MRRSTGQQRRHQDLPSLRVWILHLMSIVCLTAGLSLCASGQDRAIVQQPGGSRLPIPGLIEDYNGQYLIMQIRSGEAPRRYLRDDVIEVQTTYTKHHEKGRKLLLEGRISEAKTEFNAALDEEDRQWVRREILAQLTRCALWTGNYRAAVASFVPIFESDPETIHFDVAPFAWTESIATPDLKLDAANWIKEKSSFMKLLGASFLLFDRALNDDAEAVLRRLGRDSNSKLQRVAQMQTWRVRSATGAITPSELIRWETTIEDAPDELRGGGYFVLGQTYRRLQEPDRSAATLLWLPMVYGANRHLAAQACYEAAEQIESFGDVSEAEKLYREAAIRFGDTPFGPKAEAKWEGLQKGGSPK